MKADKIGRNGRHLIHILNDLLLTCRIRTSWLQRSLFIETFHHWIHRSLYCRSYKRKSISMLSDQQFSLENPRYVFKWTFYNMFLKVAAIVFLFLIWLRFPHSKSLSQIIRRQNGDKIIKRLHKFQKIDYHLWKAELDLEFLVKYRDNKMIHKFLNFRLANRSLRFCLAYVHCQSNLLLEEIRLKKSNVRVLRKEFDNLRSSLQQQINSID